jgi:hypothetical protein
VDLGELDQEERARVKEGGEQEIRRSGGFEFFYSPDLLISCGF